MNNGLTAASFRMALPIVCAIALLGAGVPAHASTLVIDATYDSSITKDANASAIEGAINAAITTIEGDITSPNNIAVGIYFTEMSGGLGASNTSVALPTYDQYYTAFKAVATSAAQQTALNSLGAAPGPASGNPANGNQFVEISTAEARNLGFSASVGTIAVGGNHYDSEIGLNTSITYPPQSNNGSNYGLEAVAMHEIDEALGIGGDGSTLTASGALNGAVGPLDLFRYTAAGVRSYTNAQTSSPYSYFSIDGGNTVISYFNQTNPGDFGDWLSNPIPSGFSVQVQDAFGGPGTNPTLGTSEIAALGTIGYTVTTAPEPSTILLSFSALAIFAVAHWRRCSS